MAPGFDPSDAIKGSAHELTRRVIHFMSDRQIPGWEELHLDAEGGTILISGRLPSTHSKWLCLECCRHVAGVVAVIDRVAVVDLVGGHTAKPFWFRDIEN